MDPIRVNFSNSLVNLSSSILNYYGVTPFHHTIQAMDEILSSHENKKVAVLLFDGLNKYIRRLHLKPTDALIKKRKFDITSVFPPTTVAATTAFLTGLYPYETGWLGWCQHFNDLNVTVDMFSNNISKTTVKYHEDISYKYCPFKTIIELINERTIYKAGSVYPIKINNGEAKNLDSFFSNIDNKLKSNDFIYAYWTDPDSTIHQNGVNDISVKTIIKNINKKVTKLAKDNKDTIFIVIADHGLIDSVYDDITIHDDLYQLLEIDPFLDSRAVFVKIKDNQQALFKRLFEEYYGKDYRIYSKNDVIENKFFGEGKKHKYFDNFLGDFLIVSLNEHTLLIPKEGETPLIACHSGTMEEEAIIEVSVFNS